jgi:hypothetical protein
MAFQELFALSKIRPHGILTGEKEQTGLEKLFLRIAFFPRSSNLLLPLFDVKHHYSASSQPFIKRCSRRREGNLPCRPCLSDGVDKYPPELTATIQAINCDFGRRCRRCHMCSFIRRSHDNDAKGKYTLLHVSWWLDSRQFILTTKA